MKRDGCRMRGWGVIMGSVSNDQGEWGVTSCGRNGPSQQIFFSQCECAKNGYSIMMIVRWEKCKHGGVKLCVKVATIWRENFECWRTWQILEQKRSFLQRISYIFCRFPLFFPFFPHDHALFFSFSI